MLVIAVKDVAGDARCSRPDQIRGRNLHGIGDDVGPVRYKPIPQDMVEERVAQ
jgi:hypothetical protein